jgi:hypothetical protein
MLWLQQLSTILVMYKASNSCTIPRTFIVGRWLARTLSVVAEAAEEANLNAIHFSGRRLHGNLKYK